jgi:hypothetical protein
MVIIVCSLLRVIKKYKMGGVVPFNVFLFCSKSNDSYKFGSHVSNYQTVIDCPVVLVHTDVWILSH